jgi:hypothetical protein
MMPEHSQYITRNAFHVEDRKRQPVGPYNKGRNLEETTFSNKPDFKKQYTDINKGHVNNFNFERIAQDCQRCAP